MTNFESDDDDDNDDLLLSSTEYVTKIQAHDVLRATWLQIKADESQCLELHEFCDICRRFGMKDINEVIDFSDKYSIVLISSFISLSQNELYKTNL